MDPKKVLSVALGIALVTGSLAWAAGAAEDDQPAAAATGGTGKYSEAPMLAAMVARGELPPIEERLPVEPMVLEPIEAVGKYSKTLNVFTLNINPWGDAQESPERPPHLMRMTLDGDIIPEIASGYDAAADHLSFTLYLREGLKWSDGDEFTAADIMFKYHDMDQHDQVETWGIRSEITGLRAIDDYTVVFDFDQSYPNLLLDMIDYRATDWVYWAPEHYLKQWHIEYNEDADAKAKEEGYDTWYEALHYHANFFPSQDMERPTLDSWHHEEFTTTHKIFERNPYFYIVDTAGQQLPYIDRIISTIVDAETYTLKIISGEADFAIHPLNLENFTLYKENEATGNYVVHQVPGILGGNAAYALNLNHPDPVRREIYQDIRFRRALSLAMDREEINRISFKGLAVPRQATIVSGASYYKPEWGENHPYARFDVDEANRLLDDMGLTERDGDGFRVGSDGETILLIIEYVTGQTGFSVHELVKEYWETVGLKTKINTQAGAVLGERRNSINHDIMTRHVSNSSEVNNFVAKGGTFNVHSGDFSIGWDWGLWLQANDDVTAGRKELADFTDGALPGEEPPDDIKEWWNILRVERPRAVYGSQEYRDLSVRFFDMLADKLYIIGTVGEAPSLLIARPNLRNLPPQYPQYAEGVTNLNYYNNQFFFD